MFRSLIVLAIAAACVLWAGIYILAQDDEYTLPPVKLKPERPTTAKPIPPIPDERSSPSEPAPPAEAPKAPPAETPKAPPAETPKAPTAPPKPVVLDPLPPPPDLTAPPKPVVLDPLPPPPPDLMTPIELPPPAPKAPAPKAPAPKALAPTAPAKAPETPADLPLPPLPPMPPELKTPAPPALAVPARPTDVQKTIAEAQVEPAVEPDLTGMGEVGLVEEVTRARKAYGRALLALKDYYQSRAAMTKIDWINAEFDAFSKVPKTQYLTVAQLSGPQLRPLRRIEAADQLYTEGVHYKDYPALPPGKKDYLKVAIEKFQTIVEKYPESDKISDAAFRLGEIYGGWYFQDYARAVEAYERCWQWDPKTRQPALFNAARIYDDKLRNRVKAVELYNRVMAESPDQDLVNQARDRIRALTGK